MKKHLLHVFYLFFAFGILVILLTGLNKEVDYQVFTIRQCVTLSKMDWSYARLFIYCMCKRVGNFIILYLITRLCYKKYPLFFIFAWYSFCLGAVLEMIIQKYGAVGPILLVVGLFPQYILYGFIFYKMIKRGLENQRKKAMDLILFGVVIIGVFLESYVNPFLMKYFMKLFLRIFIYM